MKVLTVLFVLLLSTPCQAALNCMTEKAMTAVMAYNGYLEIEGGSGTLGDVKLYLNISGAFILVMIDDKHNACEILKGRHWYIWQDKSA